jgi:hypothetical protein
MQVIIEDVQCWMDGGSVTLKMSYNETDFFEVEFVQKVSLINRENFSKPGSLLLDGKEVEIRSSLESEIISKIKMAVFGPKIIESEKDLLKKIISESLEFVESENYIEIAKKMERIY